MIMRRYLEQGNLLSTERLILDDEVFYDLNCADTYPVAGAWTEFMIETYGVEKFKAFYCSQDYAKDADAIFGCSLAQLQERLVEWIRE